MVSDGGTDKPGVFFSDESDSAYLPEQTNYGDAEKLARAELPRLDPVVQAKRCGARVVEQKKTRTILEVPWFGRPIQVTFPDGEVRDPESEREVPIWERILLLHYLEGDSPAPSLSELIGFAQVPSGGFYFDAYKRRSHDPLAKAFGEQPGLLIDAGTQFGGVKEDLGDAAVRVMITPKVPVVAVVYAADDEFPADAKILFESSIIAYFCTEDIAVLGGLTAGRLIRAAQKGDGVASK